MTSRYPQNRQQQQQHLLNSSYQQNQSVPRNYQNAQCPPGNQINSLSANNQYNNNINQAKNHSRQENKPFGTDHQNFSSKQNNQNINQADNLQHVKQDASDQQTPQQETKQIIHKVEYGDTLQGLSLIYDVPISRIKQRNNIGDNSIYYLKEIIVPNPQAQPLCSVKGEQICTQEFMAFMPFEQKSEQVARCYLEKSQWNVSEAVKTFRGDMQRERRNKVQYTSLPIAQKQSKYTYSYEEIQYKKRQ